jgi:hypothetical protein
MRVRSANFKKHQISLNGKSIPIQGSVDALYMDIFLEDFAYN